MINELFVGAWLVLSPTNTLPYSSMHLCNIAKEQLDKSDNNFRPTCIIGNNPMYGDVPKQNEPVKK